jgi:hypothetical protein
MKNTEKLTLLKDILNNRKYIEGSFVKIIDNKYNDKYNDNDNTTVSTKKTKEKILKNILIKHNNNINILNMEKNLSLKENENEYENLNKKEEINKINITEFENKEKLYDKLKSSPIYYKKDTIFSDSNMKNNLINNKESKKLHNNLLETAKYFNLDN